MEEVLEKMESAIINPEPKTIKTDFECLYKNWGKLGNQEERRRELLENQKNNRNNKVDKFRGILELVNAVEENDIFQRDNEKKTYYRPRVHVAGFNRTSLSYNNILMMSEWMVERPDDFHENWYVSPCPKGVRMVVVASRGRTKCFTKYGQYKFETRTFLPGGNPYDQSGKRMSCCCVLDCFYQEQNNTMYVIDFLAWNNQPMTDCDTEFRNFWLQSQFAETPELGVVTKKNKVRMVLLPKVPCTLEKFNEFMMTWPLFEQVDMPLLDGLLFYHKKAHYTPGQTPLVGWLYPFMVPEILGADITVHTAYLAQKPENYVDQATFIKEFEEQYSKKDNKRNLSSRNRDSMDTSDVANSEPKTGENGQEAHVMEAEEMPVKALIDNEKLEMESSNNDPKESTIGGDAVKQECTT